MDVDRIQRINALALNLMKQGLAQDREDAVIQAERMVRNDTVKDYQSFKDTMQAVKAEAQPAAAAPQESTVQDDLHPEKIKDILQQNTQFMVKKIKEFQEKVDSLEKELAGLRTRMTYEWLPTAQDVRGSAQGTEENGTVTNTPKSPGNPPTNAVHPRSGNYKESDVSIEKFFYMGNKK